MISSPVRAWLIERARLEPSLLEGPGFLAAVRDAMKLAGCDHETALAAALDSGPDLLDHLISSIAVPETWFFRYPHSYRVLEAHLTPLAARAAPVRMLSFGCATGEEPYSMAMSALHAGVDAARLEILAADRSRRAILAGRAATYGGASFRGELPPWSASCFEPAGERAQVVGPVRGVVRFLEAVSPRDLGLPRASLDAIFCRNVLIYLSAEARLTLLAALRELLAPHGMLFVGHAEPLIAVKAGFQMTPEPQAFALSVWAPPLAQMPHRRPVPGRANPSPPPAAVDHASGADAMLLEEARALADAGNTSRSESILTRLIARRKPDAAALELLGLVRLSREDRRQARACFEHAIAIDPERPASLLQLAMLCEKAGDAAAARQYWSRVRHAPPLPGSVSS